MGNLLNSLAGRHSRALGNPKKDRPARIMQMNKLIGLSQTPRRSRRGRFIAPTADLSALGSSPASFVTIHYRPLGIAKLICKIHHLLVAKHNIGETGTAYKQAASSHRKNSEQNAHYLLTIPTSGTKKHQASNRHFKKIVSKMLTICSLS